MARRRSLEEEGALIELTPMIDVVFLLLIFFMVSTRVFDPHGFEVELPDAEAAPQVSGNTDVFVLSVLADGSASHKGKKFHKESELTIPEDIKEGVIRADRNASHGDVMRWMDRLQGAGIESVTLASIPAGQKDH